jgi:hypothetical protein
VINGISLNTYNADEPTNKMTLQQAIAGSMMGVLYTEIINFKATSASTSSATAALHSLRQHLRLHALTDSNAIQISYTVSTSSVLSTQQLEAQLSDSVSTGNFNTLMQAYATAVGATALETATSDSITITTDNHSSSDKLTTAELVGVIVGSVACVAILIALACCLLRPKKGLLNQPGVEL